MLTVRLRLLPKQPLQRRQLQAFLLSLLVAKSTRAICRINTRLSGVLVLPMRLVSVVMLILDMVFEIVLMVLVVLLLQAL